jgi:hypothetical protein
VLDKNGESGTMHRQFASGESANLAKEDFVVGRQPSLTVPPPPPPSAEERDWRRLKDSSDIVELGKFRNTYPNTRYKEDLEEKLDNLYWEKAKGGAAPALEEYLGQFPNGRHWAEAQEGLAWDKAEASNTVQAFHDYQRQYPKGTHFDLAGQEIESMRVQEARTSEEEAILQSYLKDYPSGEHHDEIYKHLDDVVWNKTRKNELTSLRAYLERFERGRHAEEAQNEIEKLTAPKLTKETPKPVVDDKAAIREVIDQYDRAYSDRNIDELRRIWPGMAKKQVSNLRDFFKTAKNIRSSYMFDDEPQITGDEATVRFTQKVTYTVEGGNERPLSWTRTAKLRRESSPGAPGWKIESLSGD